MNVKTAILLVGNLRTWDMCRDNFISVFGEHRPDVFVTTYDMQYAYHPYIKQSLNFYEDQMLTNDSIMSKFAGLNLVGVRIDEISTYVERNVKPFISNRFPKDAFLSLSQYFKLHDGLKMVQDHEQAIGEKYDVIVKTRFDVLHDRYSVPPVDKIHIDGSGAGVFPCDWIFACSRENALKMDSFIVEEMKDMKNETSLVDLPHKLFLNGIVSTKAELVPMPLIKGIVRAR